MQRTRHFDVLVLGAGLAGLTAALKAASLGCTVALAYDARAGASSFSKATWGLGMVTESKDEKLRASESLFKALCDVGMGMNMPNLSQTLVERSEDALAFLASQGASFMLPTDPTQREFVACFDKVPRTWRGFSGNDSRVALMQSLSDLGVSIFDRCSDILTLVRDVDGAVCGAILLETLRDTGNTLHNMYTPLLLTANATILATGGMCGLYENHLCPDRDDAMGHMAAVDAGARLVNIEFQQLMLGIEPSGAVTRPYVYNEKLYRWSHFATSSGLDAFVEHGLTPEERDEALEAHSWHGPYTTRLASHVVEEVLSQGSKDGLPYLLGYDKDKMIAEHSEFVDTYVEWLKKTNGSDLALDLRYAVRMYAHSSNGGIAIGEDAHTQVPGLLACGECAGGVHGADRIGGLASVTAATFGMIAGETAATQPKVDGLGLLDLNPCSRLFVSDDRLVGEAAFGIGRILDSSCMVNRDHDTLIAAQAELERRLALISQPSRELSLEQLFKLGGEHGEAGSRTLWSASRAQACYQQLRAASAIVKACLARTESRGSHHRSDFPACDERQAKPNYLTSKDLLDL